MMHKQNFWFSFGTNSRYYKKYLVVTDSSFGAKLRCIPNEFAKDKSSYKHFMSVNYDPRVIIWTIF